MIMRKIYEFCSIALYLGQNKSGKVMISITGQSAFSIASFQNRINLSTIFEKLGFTLHFTANNS